MTTETLDPGAYEAQVARVLAGLTPEQIRGALRELVAAQPERLRSGITAFELVDAILGPLAAASGPAAWRARMAAVQALRERIAGMEGVKFVEGDA